MISPTIKSRRSLKYFARGIGEIDRAFDAIAKPELLRQPHGRFADRKDAAGATDLVDDVAPVMRLDLFLHGRHHLRRAQVHFLMRRRAAGDQICAQDIFAGTRARTPANLRAADRSAFEKPRWKSKRAVADPAFSESSTR